jgi:hypothetical protein
MTYHRRAVLAALLLLCLCVARVRALSDPARDLRCAGIGAPAQVSGFCMCVC